MDSPQTNFYQSKLLSAHKSSSMENSFCLLTGAIYTNSNLANCIFVTQEKLNYGCKFLLSKQYPTVLFY